MKTNGPTAILATLLTVVAVVFASSPIPAQSQEGDGTTVVPPLPEEPPLPIAEMVQGFLDEPWQNRRFARWAFSQCQPHAWQRELAERLTALPLEPRLTGDLTTVWAGIGTYCDNDQLDAWFRKVLDAATEDNNFVFYASQYFNNAWVARRRGVPIIEGGPPPLRPSAESIQVLRDFAENTSRSDAVRSQAMERIVAGYGTDWQARMTELEDMLRRGRAPSGYLWNEGGILSGTAPPPETRERFFRVVREHLMEGPISVSDAPVLDLVRAHLVMEPEAHQDEIPWFERVVNDLRNRPDLPERVQEVVRQSVQDLRRIRPRG